MPPNFTQSNTIRGQEALELRMGNVAIECSLIIILTISRISLYFIRSSKNHWDIFTDMQIKILRAFGNKPVSKSGR